MVRPGPRGRPARRRAERLSRLLSVVANLCIGAASYTNAVDLFAVSRVDEQLWWWTGAVVGLSMYATLAAGALSFRCGGCGGALVVGLGSAGPPRRGNRTDRRSRCPWHESVRTGYAGLTGRQMSVTLAALG